MAEVTANYHEKYKTVVAGAISLLARVMTLCGSSFVNGRIYESD